MRMDQGRSDTTGRARRGLTVVMLCLGGMAVAITQTVVIPIQGQLPEILGSSAANTSWVITATLLAAAASMPIAGRLGDIVGKRPILIATSALLALGSIICALSVTLAPVLVGRALQGLALGFVPVGIALLREITPPAITPAAIATMSATMGVGGAIGLPVAAAIASAGGFHALFWMSTAVAGVMLVGIVALVPAGRPGAGGRLDLVGALGLAGALVAILIAVTKGREWGWSSPVTLVTLSGGVLLLLAWGWFELKQAHPLLDLRVTARPVVLLTDLVGLAMGFGQLAMTVAIPQLLQLPTSTGYGLGLTILVAGLWMAPPGLMMLVVAPISAALIRRVGAKWTLLVGIAVVAAGYAAAFFLMAAPWQLMLSACIASAGVGIGYAAMPTLILGAVPASEAGSAVSVNSLMRSIGSTVAAAVMATVLAATAATIGGAEVPTIAGFQICFAIALGAAVAGAVIALCIPATRVDTRSLDVVDAPVTAPEPARA